MPTTITAYNTFVANTKARASEVNTNFNNHRGTLLPINTDTASASDLSHNLGSDEHRWNGAFVGSIDFETSTSTASIVLQGQTGNTLGALELLIEGVTSSVFDTNPQVTTVTFTANGTWTAPSWINNATFFICGGGGGGGGGRAGAGGGGGAQGGAGAQPVTAYVPVTGGVEYTVNIGAGGTGGTGATNAGSTSGLSGASSWVGLTSTNALISVYGGRGGSHAGTAVVSGSQVVAKGAFVGGGGGEGASGTNASAGFDSLFSLGGSTGVHSAGTTAGGLGGGGGAGYATGGTGGNPNTNATTSAYTGGAGTYGSGGGGGGGGWYDGGATETSGGNGGPGGDGYIEITYIKNY